MFHFVQLTIRDTQNPLQHIADSSPTVDNTHTNIFTRSSDNDNYFASRS